MGATGLHWVMWLSSRVHTATAERANFVSCRTLVRSVRYQQGEVEEDCKRKEKKYPKKRPRTGLRRKNISDVTKKCVGQHSNVVDMVSL